jgi:hypothetical protein
VIERSLQYLVKIQVQKYWSLSWEEFNNDIKKSFSEQQISSLKAIASFLTKKWQTSLGNMNFREIRNKIIHPASKSLEKRELSVLFTKFRKEIIGNDENLDDLDCLFKKITQLQEFRRSEDKEF